jgi:hypothetical protein
LLPSQSEDSYDLNQYYFTAWLITITICKALSIIYKIIFEQCDMDIFLIDWESPRMFHKTGQLPKQDVNPWRRLFIVNEFNELQISRHISTEIMLLIFLVIAEGLGVKYFSSMEPTL